MSRSSTGVNVNYNRLAHKMLQFFSFFTLRHHYLPFRKAKKNFNQGEMRKKNLNTLPTVFSHTASQQHSILSSSFFFGLYLFLSHHPHVVSPLILLFSFLFLFKNSDIFSSILHPSLTQKPYGSRLGDTFFSGKWEKNPKTE